MSLAKAVVEHFGRRGRSGIDLGRDVTVARPSPSCKLQDEDKASVGAAVREAISSKVIDIHFASVFAPCADEIRNENHQETE